jgi:hypothetical protein
VDDEAEAEDSEFLPPVERMRMTTTIASSEQRLEVIDLDDDDATTSNSEDSRQLDIHEEVSPSDEDVLELRLLPIRQRTTAPPAIQRQAKMEPETNMLLLESESHEESLINDELLKFQSPVIRVRRATTVLSTVQHQATKEHRSDGLLLELGFHRAVPVIEEVTESQPTVKCVHRSTMPSVQATAETCPDSSTSESDSREVTPAFEGDSEFQYLVGLLPKATTVASTGQRQDSRIASPALKKERDFHSPVERVSTLAVSESQLSPQRDTDDAPVEPPTDVDVPW